MENTTAIWKIDPSHSEVQFKVKHLVISTVSGFFREFSGEMEGNPQRSDTAKFNFKAQTSSISTNNADRDGHLKSAEFFDAENNPEISFKSSKVEQSGDDIKIHGELNIKGQTKQIILNAEFGGVMEDPYGQTKAGFEIKGKISRKEFGLNWNAMTEAGGIVVGDEVKLIANLQFVKQ